MLDWLEGPAVIATLRRVKELGRPVVGLRLRDADCSGEDLSGLMLAESELVGVKFDRVNLTGALFSDTKFVDVSFDQAILAQAKFFKSSLSHCSAVSAVGRRLTFAQSELKQFDASSAKWIEAQFVQTAFVDAKLVGINLNTAAMVMCTHEGTDFTDALLEQTSLFKLDLRSCVFTRAKGPRTVLTSSNLSGVNLEEVQMPQAQCGGTSFAKARLSRANFSCANFIDANLTGCEMHGCDLSLAAFLRVKMADAVLDSAILNRARFVRTKAPQRLTQLNFSTSQVFNWGATTCGDSELKIFVDNMTLTTRWSGEFGFERFLRDFRDGRKTFLPRDFPDQREALAALGIKKIDVVFKISDGALLQEAVAKYESEAAERSALAAEKLALEQAQAARTEKSLTSQISGLSSKADKPVLPSKSVTCTL